MENPNDEQDENTIKIDVDLNEMIKLYPSVEATSKGLMKVIGQ